MAIRSDEIAMFGQIQFNDFNPDLNSCKLSLNKTRIFITRKNTKLLSSDLSGWKEVSFTRRLLSVNSVRV